MVAAQRLLRRAEVEHLCGLSRSQIYRMLEEGKFPVPVTVGARAKRWREDEIALWIESRPRSETH